MGKSISNLQVDVHVDEFLGAGAISDEQVRKYAIDLTKSLQLEKEGRKELERLNEDLERSNEELKEFAFIASHDLKEPLRKISIFSDLLELQKENLDDIGLNYLNRMQSAALRMQKYLDDLLFYSRVNTTNIRITPVDLNQIVSEILEDLDLLIHKSDTEVHVKKLPVIKTSEFHVRQILFNIVSNAVKFFSDARNQVVEIDSTLKDSAWEIAISDNGIGMDQKYLGQIFKPFKRLNGRSQFEGSGMGLAICKKALKRCGGSLVVRSELDRGSTFFVTLPDNIEII